MSDPVAAHEAYAPPRLGWGVLTVSSSRGEADDHGGDLLVGLLAASGHREVQRRLVPDAAPAIAGAVRDLLASPAVDIVVVTGGTGVSPSDVTPQAVTPLLERSLEGFGELFRALSFAEIGAAALLSRAIAGVVGFKAVFVLPGSPAAVELGMGRLILPVALHLVGQLRRER